MLADSSEQHGEDWLQVAYLQVAAQDIVPVSNAVDRLQSFFDSDDYDVDMELPQDIQELSTLVMKACKHHVLPPGGVGAKHASLWHKTTVKYPGRQAARHIYACVICVICGVCHMRDICGI